MSRVNIPEKMYERLLEKNAHSCCVCKKTGIGLNLHHIDGDNSNTIDENLAVLCVNEHDAHHRPIKYPSLKHLDLSKESLKEHKNKWEKFIEECKKDSPNVIATINAFGTEESIIGMRIIFQYTTGEMVFKREYQMLDGPMEMWIDNAINEVLRFGKNIKMAVINKPLAVEYCERDNQSLSTVLDEPAAVKVAVNDWKEKSIATIYVNPTQPSLAIAIFYGSNHLLSIFIHRCKERIHILDYKKERVINFNRKQSKRTQITNIVKRILREWEITQVVYGTGDDSNPTIITSLKLPHFWENEKCSK